MMTKRSNHMPAFTHMHDDKDDPEVVPALLEPEELRRNTLQDIMHQ